MKKIFSICFCLLFLMNVAFSQDWKYGVALGVTNANYLLDNVKSGVSRSTSSTFNGHVSGWVTLSPSRYFGVETGASVMGLGATLKTSEFGKREVQQHTYWLQVPVNVVGKLPLADSSSFFLKAGGYVGFGLFGKNYVPSSYSGSAKQEFLFGSGGTQKGLDLGWTLNLGYKLKSGYLINLGYQRGLKDLAPDNASYEQRNRAYTIGVGYEF